jgi:hypothetical protein
VQIRKDQRVTDLRCDDLRCYDLLRHASIVAAQCYEVMNWEPLTGQR